MKDDLYNYSYKDTFNYIFNRNFFFNINTFFAKTVYISCG